MANKINNIQYNIPLNGAGKILIDLPDNYEYINILNNNPYAFQLYNSTTADVNAMIASMPNYFIGAIPLCIQTTGGVHNKLLLTWQGSGIGFARVLFSETQLTTNQQFQALTATSNSIITGDTIGLAKSAQLPVGLTVLGNLKTALQEAIPAGTNVIGKVDVNTIPGYSFRNITTAATTTVKSGAGILKCVLIGGVGTTMVVALYDSLTGSGTLIGTLSAPVFGDLELDIAFTTGLTVVTSGTVGNVTIIYK